MSNDSFVIYASDVVILISKIHPILRLIDTGKDPSVSAVLLFRKVTDLERYGIPTLQKINHSKFLVKKVIEKSTNPTSNNGLIPLYYFKSKIFEKLRKINPGKNNEFQLTNTLQQLIKDGEKVLAIPLLKNEKVLDVGTVNSYRHAQLDSFKFLSS